MHIAASMFINDDERGLYADHERWREGSAPHAPIDQCRPGGRLHDGSGEDNAHAHLKRQIMGCEVAGRAA